MLYHAQLYGTLFSHGTVITLNWCRGQHNKNTLQFFSAVTEPNIVKFGQHLAELFPK